MKKLSATFDRLAKENPKFAKVAAIGVYAGIPLGIVGLCFATPVAVVSGLYYGATQLTSQSKNTNDK